MTLAFPSRKGDADRSEWGVRRRWSVWTGVLSSVAVKERRGGRGRRRKGGHLGGRHRSTCLCADRKAC